MRTLPSWIVDLNAPQTRLQRKSFSEAGLNESDLDKLVIDQQELLADVLIENDLIDEGAHLLYIGRQLHGVDILFAEVDEEDEPLRLVLVEDKLLKNPEAKRSVIGQIVEYAARFQGSVRTEELAKRYPEHRAWVEQNAELLDRQVELGDFLLVVCGDSIHSSVADIVTRLTRRADRHPMSGMQLCLVAMDLYVGGVQRLLIPHVIGRVARSERQLRISVVDAHGGFLKTTHSETESPSAGPTPRVKGHSTEEEFFRDAWDKKFGKEAAVEWRLFMDRVRAAEIPGLSVSTTSAGRPSLDLRSALLDSVVSVLRARFGAPGIRDVCGTKIWERNPKAVAARDQFRQALLRIGGATETSKHEVMVPMKSLRSGTPPLIDALQRFAEALDSAI